MNCSGDGEPATLTFAVGGAVPLREVFIALMSMPAPVRTQKFTISHPLLLHTLPGLAPDGLRCFVPLSWRGARRIVIESVYIQWGEPYAKRSRLTPAMMAPVSDPSRCRGESLVDYLASPPVITSLVIEGCDLEYYIEVTINQLPPRCSYLSLYWRFYSDFDWTLIGTYLLYLVTRWYILYLVTRWFNNIFIYLLFFYFIFYFYFYLYLCICFSLFNSYVVYILHFYSTV